MKGLIISISVFLTVILLWALWYGKTLLKRTKALEKKDERFRELLDKLHSISSKMSSLSSQFKSFIKNIAEEMLFIEAKIRELIVEIVSDILIIEVKIKDFIGHIAKEMFLLETLLKTFISRIVEEMLSLNQLLKNFHTYKSPKILSLNAKTKQLNWKNKHLESILLPPKRKSPNWAYSFKAIENLSDILSEQRFNLENRRIRIKPERGKMEELLEDKITKYLEEELGYSSKSPTGSIRQEINYLNPSDNFFYFKRQKTLRNEKNARRPDILIYINDLPRVIIELKSPLREWDEYHARGEARRQVLDYYKEGFTIFKYISIAIIGNGIKWEYSLEPFNNWYPINNLDMHPIRKIFSKSYLLMFLNLAYIINT